MVGIAVELADQASTLHQEVIQNTLETAVLLELEATLMATLTELTHNKMLETAVTVA